MSEKQEEQRFDPLQPAFLTGKTKSEVHVSSNYKGPAEIKQTQTSPLVAFITNKSYEKKQREKGPVAEPLPFVW